MWKLELPTPLACNLYRIRQELTAGRGKPKAEPKTMARRASHPRANLTCLGRRPNGFATSGPQTAATGLLTTELGINLKAMILKEREYMGAVHYTDDGLYKRLQKKVVPCSQYKSPSPEGLYDPGGNRRAETGFRSRSKTRLGA